MSDRGSIATNRLDRKTQRLLCHLSLVGFVLEDRLSARELLEAKIGDLTPFCTAQIDAGPARAEGSGPGGAA